MSLGFDVPAEFFYALTAQLPTTLDMAARYEFATTNFPDANLKTLQAAIDTTAIPATAGSPAITPEQAVWRLAALGGVTPSATTFSLTATDPWAAKVPALVTQWLAFKPTPPSPAPSPPAPPNPEADLTTFWTNVVAVDPNLMAAQLALALVAMAQQSDLSSFFTALRSTAPALAPAPSGTALAFTVASVKDLDPAAYPPPPAPASPLSAIAFDQWLAFFEAPAPSTLSATALPVMPLFAIVGTGWTPGGGTLPTTKQLQQQTTAFVLRLTQFFGAPGILPANPVAPTAGGLPQLPLPLPALEPFSAFAAALSALPPPLAGFTQYGATPTLDPNAANAAAAAVFTSDTRAQAWLVEAASAINALVWVTSTSSLSGLPTLQFSVVEALYARGFVSVAEIAAVPADMFADAVRGTPAYPYRADLQTRALTVASPVPLPPVPAPPPSPINAGGKLTNCIAPPWLSPLGPVAHLRDLWNLSESADCEHPASALSPTLGDSVALRRGPLGTSLHATKQNLDTPLPRIDLVNEALESFVGTGSAPVIYETTVADPNPARVLAAAPEHSTPTVSTSLAYTTLAGNQPERPERWVSGRS